MEALDNAWYGSWRPLTNLTQTFRACHLRTFNVAAIFFGAIPTYGVLPYAMIWKSTVQHTRCRARSGSPQLSGLLARSLPVQVAKAYAVHTTERGAQHNPCGHARLVKALHLAAYI